jgi:CheY-like chemotaxis protein
VAVDGLDALRQLDRNPPDLVVLDLGLPIIAALFLLGYEKSTRTKYPIMNDPDVPFVRVKLFVTPFEQACAPPTTIPGTATVPIIDAVERLDWRRPQ